MIQDNSGNDNGSNSYLNPSNMPITQNISLFGIVDESVFVTNGNFTVVDIQQHNQQIQQMDVNESGMTLLQQEEQQQHLYQQQNQDQYYTYFTSEEEQQQSQHCLNILPVDNSPLGAEENSPIDPNMSGLSEATTVEGDINDGKYADLMGLNSANLMQFSQQSALLEMAQEHLNDGQIIPTLPTLDEHDAGGYNFNLDISKKLNKVNWKYSNQLNKLYIRMNEIFSIDAVYTQKMPIQELRIRMLICFVKEVSEPVLRCQNHISKENENNTKKRESLLRCENPNAEYCGSSDGKSVKDRFSILVPLTPTRSVKPNDKSIKQTIALKFTCQNSCIGRKETCIIFLLEGMNGEILSQRLLNVRICSCPKRDLSLDEKNIATKRKTDGDIFPHEAKVPKRDNTQQISPIIKEEDNNSSDYEGTSKQFDIQRTASGGFRLIMELSTKEIALSTIEYGMGQECINIVSKSKDAPRSSRNYRKLSRLHNACKDLD